MAEATPEIQELPWWIGKSRKKKKKRFIDLSLREEEVLERLLKAKVEVVAESLSIAETTVRSHRSIVRRKEKDAKAFLRRLKRYKSVLKKE